MVRIGFWLFFISTTAFGAKVQVQDPCGDDLWLDVEVPVASGESVGALTVRTFETHALEFVGTETGIHSIRGTVIGDDALEIISDRSMRAYGWCYKFNGRQPDLLPDQVQMTGSNDIVYWFFGYAEYESGAWISYCTPTSVARPPFICGTSRH